VIADLGLVGGYVSDFITLCVGWAGMMDLRSKAVETTGDGRDRDDGEEELLRGRRPGIW
jgi:hypothetical protein